MKKKLIVPRVEVKESTSIRLKPSRRVALQKAASEHDCTANALIEAIIDTWLKEEGYLKGVV